MAGAEVRDLNHGDQSELPGPNGVEDSISEGL